MSNAPFRLLSPTGEPVADIDADVDTIRARYAAMVTARAYDHKASALQRQGRLATYAQFEGQEACQIGAAAPLAATDWLVATYRDAAAMHQHGFPWWSLLLVRMGDERGNSPPDGVNIMPWSVTVGGHMIHAVGISWAMRLQGGDGVALTMFGDGATSEGDFHEAMNFAGVYGLPTVFFCQNNGWAISTPVEQQTASPTIARKADAYGFDGVLVDGNDVLAVEKAVGDAVARGRAGNGPTLIEARTFRIHGHTTTDDHGKYRPGAHVDEWRQRDPLERVRLYLERREAWSPDWQDELEQAASAEIESGRRRGRSDRRARRGRDPRRDVRRAHPAADRAAQGLDRRRPCLR